MSLKSFLEYLKLEKNYSNHTLVAYEGDINSFFDFAKITYETEDPEAITYPIIRSWIVSLSEAEITHRTINRKIASLKSFYKFLQKIGVLEVSPLARHRSMKVKQKVQVPFSEAEIENAIEQLKSASDFTGIRNHLLIELFYATGIRRSELINVKLEDVDLYAKTLKVLGKRNKERLIPLIDPLILTIFNYLEYRRKEFPECISPYLLLTDKGVKMYSTLVYRIINNYFSRVSLKVKTSPHVLRHTFATHLLNGGADMNSVKELMGHSSLASTQIYTHNNIAQLQKIYGKAHPRNEKEEIME
ncbi:MAG: tyrosine-type recombinase/integrase [Leeuwenhoekiella sp.]